MTGAVPASQLADGQSYYFQARTNDGIDTGPWSKVCEFTVDTTLPDKIPTVSSTDYPNDDSSHGGVGRTGRFIFGSNGVSDHGVNDIVGYRYSLTSCAPTSATEVKVGTPGSSATVAITPTNSRTGDSVRTIGRSSRQRLRPAALPVLHQICHRPDDQLPR
ncbi:hypothetical protein [Fodinicola feengrottensis]|uniref:hypothetical protein n=1 Tax=Fodinicola feengrottensis TaxID=435914 RepID=UPI002441C9E8|nr:hypothetical protein [Fodinicola feengrottensis]